MKTILLSILLFATSLHGASSVAFLAALQGTNAAAGGGGGSGAQPSLTNSLLAYWRLDETSTGNGATQADVTGRGNDFTIVGGGVSNTNGVVTNAAQYTYANLSQRADTADVSMTTGKTYSINYQIRRPFTTSAAVDKNSNEYFFGRTFDDTFIFRVYDSVSGNIEAVVTDTTTVTNEGWHHVLLWVGGDNKARIRMNGGATNVSTTALANGPINGTGPLYLNALFSTDYGRYVLDEFGIWGRELNTEEQNRLAAARTNATAITYPTF
jgi:hypothetical protein